MANLFDELQAINNTPDKQKARSALRAKRSELFGDRLKKALGITSKQARSLWSIDDDTDLAHQPIGGMHPGAAAVMYAREALGEFDIPSKVEFRYTGMHRSSGSGAHHLTEGVVKIKASFRSLSGVGHTIDIPVIVHDGHMIRPEVIVHDGRPRVMAQSAFDDIIGRGETYRKANDRKMLYSPPPHKDDNRKNKPIPTINSGLYSVKPGRNIVSQLTPEQGAGYEREWKEGPTPEKMLEEVKHLIGERGQIPELIDIQNALQRMISSGRTAMLDEAERDRREYLKPGMTVALTNDVEMRGRGGTTKILPAGTECQIIRDMTGTGNVYYAEFLDYGFKAPVNKRDLE